MKTFLKKCFVVGINLIIFCALLGAVEAYFRITRPEVRQFPDNNGLWQIIHPYTMFMTSPGHWRQWTNLFTKENYPANVVTNALGFNDHHEFDYTKPYKKAPDERVVLFTGGSAAWGLGSSSNDTSTAGRMQYYLNTLQKEHRYTVINMAMGSWIAFQEFIGLELWGANFDPDWIVVMDGFNDAGVGCSFSQGPVNPLYYSSIKAYVNGYLFTTMHPVFYRGWLENEVIKHSAAYRALTGKQSVTDTRIYDQSSSEQSETRRSITPTKVGQSRDILAFYVKSIRSILKLFPDAGYILSTQPVVNQFTGDFTDIYQWPAGSAEHRAAIAKRTQDLERYLQAHEDEMCGEKTGQVAFTYIFGNGATQLESLAEEMRGRGRRVEYHNTGTLFPDAREERMPYFIDPVHISDKGNDALGKFYAQRILAEAVARH